MDRPSLCVEHLLQDHRKGEKILEELESLLDTPKAEGCWTAARGHNFLRVAGFFNGVVLDHMQKEEKILFPVLEAYLPRDIGPLAVLRGEHRELCAQFTRLLEAGRALSRGSTEPRICEEFERAGRAIVQGFRDHVYKEDRVLFPMVARFLSPERDAHLLRQMVQTNPQTSGLPLKKPAGQPPAKA